MNALVKDNSEAQLGNGLCVVTSLRIRKCHPPTQALKLLFGNDYLYWKNPSGDFSQQ